MGIAGLIAVLIVAGAAAAVVLWDDDGGNFTTKSFIEAVNANGAGISLGDRLFSDRENKEVWAVRLGGRPDSGGEGGGGTGGSLSVFHETEAAARELRRCRSAGTLLCIRAENVILTLEEDARGASIQRLVGALARLGGGRPSE